MRKLLDEYREKFGDQFPLMLCMGMDEEEIKALVSKCIEDGKPYDPKINDGDLY